MVSNVGIKDSEYVSYVYIESVVIVILHDCTTIHYKLSKRAKCSAEVAHTHTPNRMMLAAVASTAYNKLKHTKVLHKVVHTFVIVTFLLAGMTGDSC
jgi:hypothetical protein